VAVEAGLLKDREDVIVVGDFFRSVNDLKA
jgi:hypothetical protein